MTPRSFARSIASLQTRLAAGVDRVRAHRGMNPSLRGSVPADDTASALSQLLLPARQAHVATIP